MPLKLIQIVKELNVGLSTLVEHLAKKGYEVENKPTAKITDQMYSELLKEFQKSGDIKQQAKSVSFGAGKTGKEEPDVAATEAPKEMILVRSSYKDARCRKAQIEKLRQRSSL